MRIHHLPPDHSRSLPTQSATPPATDALHSSALDDLAAWVNLDSGANWQAHQDLAQLVRLTLDRGQKLVRLDRRLEALAQSMPRSVRKLIDLRYDRPKPPHRTAQRLPDRVDDRREGDGGNDRDRGPPEAPARRHKRRQDTAADAQPDAVEPARKKHKVGTVQAPLNALAKVSHRQSDDQAEPLARRARDVLDELKMVQWLLRRCEEVSTNLMRGTAPAKLLSGLMALLNRELPRTPWSLLGALVRDLNQMDRSALIHRHPAVQSVVKQARDMCDAVVQAMSHKDACLRSDKEPALLITALFSGLRGMALSGIAQVDAARSQALRDTYAEVMHLFSEMETSRFPNSRTVACGSNGLKAGLENGWISGAGMHKAFRKLMTLINSKVFDGANAQEIANVFNGLKAVLERGVLPDADKPQMQDSLRRLMALVNSKVFDGANAQEIGNVFNGLKAVMEAGTLPEADRPQMQDTLRRLTALASSKGFDDAKAQEIANVFNGLKTVLVTGILPEADRPQMQGTVRRLMTLVNGNPFDGAKAQAIANVFNGLRAVMEAGILPEANRPQVQDTVRRLMGLVNSKVFDGANAQEIANVFNGLKAVLETRILPDADKPLVKDTLRRLMRLVNDKVFDKTDAQAIANVFSGLKAVLEKSALPDADKPQVQDTLRRLSNLVNSDAFDEPSSQHMLNALSSLAVAVEHGLELGPSLLPALYRLLRMSFQDEGVDSDTDPRAIRSFVTAVVKLERLGHLSAEVLREQASHLLQRAQRMARENEAPINDTSVASVIAFVMAMMYRGHISAVQGWAACEALTARLPLSRQALHSTVLLEQGLRLYRHWRWLAQPDALALAQRERLVAWLSAEVDRIPWAALAPSDQAEHLRRVCLNLHRLENLLLRRRGRAQNRSHLLGVQSVLREKAIPTLRQAVLRRQGPDEFDATQLELLLIQRHLPGAQWIAPPFQAWSDAQCDALVWQAWHALAGAPRPMDHTSALRIPVLDGKGRLGKTVRVLDSSIYNTLLGSASGPVAMVELEGHGPAENMPAYVRLQRSGGREVQWMRNDLVRGGANKAAEGERAHLWSVSMEAGRFLARHWATSREARGYLQRALFPETPRIESADPTRAPGKPRKPMAIQGECPMTVVPDSAPTAFVPLGEWSVLRSYDGSGFIHEDLARLLIGDDTYERLARRTTIPFKASKGGLPAQALVHYSAKGALREAIVREFHQASKDLLQVPLARQMQIPPAAQLGGPARLGGPPNVNFTAVPASGEQMLLADTPENRTMGTEGLVLGRAPFDNRNLLNVPARHIAYANVLNRAFALQYTATGYVVQGDEHALALASDSIQLDGAPGREVPESRFYKGLLVVLPRDAWPQSHRLSQIVVSAKDLKLCSGFTSLQRKQARQNPEQPEHMQLRGCLVVCQVLDRLVAIPPAAPSRSASSSGQTDEGDFPSMKRLGGDFDGDLARLGPVRQMPALARRLAQQNRTALGSPKMPKTFHADPHGVLDMQKLRELRGKLVQNVSVVMELVLSLPKARREALVRELSESHVLEEVFQAEDGKPGAWKVLAGLGSDFDTLNADKRARRLIRRELEVMLKSATDLEKTEVAYDVLSDRMKEYKAALGHENARIKPWGKTTTERLEVLEKEREMRANAQGVGTSRHPAATPEDREAVAQQLGASLDATVYFEGLASDIVRANLSWFLERDPAPTQEQPVQRQHKASPNPAPLSAPPRSEAGQRADALPDESPPPAHAAPDEALLKARDLMGVADYMPVGFEILTEHDMLRTPEHTPEYDPDYSEEAASGDGDMIDAGFEYEDDQEPDDTR